MNAHKLTSVIHSLRLVITCCIGLSFAAACAAADEVVVQLKDGRTISGEIDARTDERCLWLRATEPSILLRSSFAWANVLSAKYGNKTLTADELQTLARTLKTTVNLERFRRPRPQVADAPVGLLPHRSRKPFASRPQDVRVASLEISAILANWDNDPEDDGLLVTVYPLTADGRLRPLDGQLNLKLFARVNQPTVEGFVNLKLFGRFDQPSRYRQRFPNVTQGSLRVRAADFGPDGAVYKFRFRNFHPEKNLGVDVFGLLTARLVVPGHGTFDASDANVQLRRLSRFRDRLQFQNGDRFLPDENRRRSP